MRKMGKFKVSMDLIRMRPEYVAAAFALIKCVPVRAEALFEDSSISYTALATVFDDVETGAVVPEYALIIDHEDGVPVRVTAKKVTEPPK